MKFKKNNLNKKNKIFLTKFIDMKKIKPVLDFSFEDEILTENDFEFKNNFAVFEVDGKYGWINQDKKTFIGGNFDFCHKFEDFGIFRKDEQYGYVNKLGQMFFIKKGFRIDGISENIILFLDEYNKYGWMNLEGEIIGEGFEECNLFKKGFGIFKKDDKYGFLNKEGNILGFDFEYLHPYNYDIINFEKLDKSGFLNSCGNIIFECDYMYGLCDDFFKFVKNCSWGWIDTSGKILIEGFDWCDDFKNGYAAFTKDNKQGWIDKNGKIYTERPY